ncbi:MAG: D-alanine--D-alanine ligase family protein [Myxococcota bacterium]
MSKLRIGILFGGRSTEHDVSISSATTILQAMDPARYTPVLIGIDHDGRWYVAEPELEFLPEAVLQNREAVPSFASLRDGLELLRGEDLSPALDGPLDVVFPIIHGRLGEDGSVQGLLEVADVPYVGTDVKATALCMDKTLAKGVLRDAGLPVLPSHEGKIHELLDDANPFLDAVERDFDYPVFVKPTNSGSSVGTQKAPSRAHLHQGIKEAGRYDLDVLVEPAVDAREIECAVLGGHTPQASALGEILFAGEFYDYEAKYMSDETRLAIPADLDPETSDEMRELAVAAFCALKCWGMARVDFFVDRARERVYINELNTHPGFTEGSMYPKLWEHSGIALPELIDRLVELALQRHRERSALELRFRLS